MPSWVHDLLLVLLVPTLGGVGGALVKIGALSTKIDSMIITSKSVALKLEEHSRRLTIVETRCEMNHGRPLPQQGYRPPQQESSPTRTR